MMKKVIVLILAAGLMNIGQAVLVDNFDSYLNGPVNDVTTQWKGTANAVILDGVMKIAEGGGTGQQSAYGILSSAASIADGVTKTMFLRFKATSAIDSSFGLTNVDEPLLGGSSWDDFRAQIAIVNGTIRARNLTSTLTLANKSTGVQVAINTDWYNLWVVVTNALGTGSDTIKLYLNQGTSGATETDLLANVSNLSQDTFFFRTVGGVSGVADTLDRFYWRAQNNANTRELMIDDIHIVDGVDLSIPEPASMLLLGLGGLVTILRKR